jgi:glycosyltransferase involved in cell wall biosynthesis
VGDGPLRRRLQAAHPDVHFAGLRRGADLARHYASADVFLFPSLTDTFGNVVLEALASALVVVAFDTAAAGLHVHPGYSGHLVRCGDAAGFIDTAVAALGNATPGSALRRHARDAALATDWSAVLRQFEHQLGRVALARPAPARHAALA